MLRRRFLYSGLASLAACGRRAAPTPAGMAFVANREGKAVAAVDLSALAVVRHIALPASPDDLTSHHLHPAVFVSIPSLATLAEVSTDKLTPGRRLRLPGPATKMRFSRDGSALWVLVPEAKQLLRVSPTGMKVEAKIALPETPVDFDLSIEQDWAAVTLGTSGKLAVVNRTQSKLTHTAELGGELGVIRFRKDARWAMVADRRERALVFFDMEARRVGVRVPLHLRPDQFCFKPDGGQLFVTGEGLDSVVTVYPYQTEVGSTMLAGRAPAMMAASLFPSYLFVANPVSNTVTILNVATQKVMGAVQVGREPAFLAITPNQEYALVLNRQSGDMSVLHIPTLSARRTKAASLFTQVPVGSEPVAAVVRAV
ncbi:MAG: hypothetical protein ABI972_06870 [Acidobacteriota bacterium]